MGTLLTAFLRALMLNSYANGILEDHTEDRAPQTYD